MAFAALGIRLWLYVTVYQTCTLIVSAPQSHDVWLRRNWPLPSMPRTAAKPQFGPITKP